MDMFSLDHLTDTEFEEFCFDLLRELGFVNIDWRKGTGFPTSPADGGRDIECHYIRKDVDGETIIETWFFDCKHYKSGVPVPALDNALAWASSQTADKLVFIASNFLSNPAKDHLKGYRRERKPSFRIAYWEKPLLEEMTS